MKQPQRYLILLLFVLLSLIHVRASAQTLDGWYGDTSAFVLKDGVLSIAEGASGSSAMIYRGFPDLGDVYSFRTETLFDKPPTSRNTFKWEVLSLRTNGGEYGLYVAPTAQGQGVGLYQELPSGTAKLLTSLTLPDKLGDWQRLKIFVDKDETKYRLRVVTPRGKAMSSDWLTSPLAGEVIRRIIFTAKFTKNARSHLRWRLPTVSKGADEGSDNETYVDAQILSIKPDPSGKVIVTLDRAVDTSKAEAHCEGHKPTLRSLPQDHKSIEIDLHRPFVEKRLYTISVQGLRTTDGSVVHTLSFEISRGTPSLYISEIMASAPEEGPLEGARYIELYNPNDAPISLHSMVLRYKSTSYSLPDVSVAPRSYFTLFAKELPLGEPPRHSIGLAKFPALSGTFVLQLIETDSGEVIDRVKFGNKLYGRGFEKGKASVERLSFSGPGDQWRRSEDPRGGTPSEPSKMEPALPVAPHALVINELLLSPPSTGEKYIELYNTSDEPIRLQDLYLRYRNKTEGDHAEWRLVTSELLIPAHGYIVLTPYPEALPRLYREVPTETLIERIDFPSLSPTYTEIALHAHATEEVIDQVVYRRQHLGSSTKDRNGFALERRHPSLDGTKETSWRRALKESKGGTPGRVNSVHDLPPLPENEEEDHAEWPEDPNLDYAQLEHYAHRYADRLVMVVYTLLGQPLVSERGTQCLHLIEDFRQGRLSWDTRLYIISVRIRGTDKQHDLHYNGKWLYQSR